MVGSLFLTLLEFEEKIKVLKDTYKDEKTNVKREIRTRSKSVIIY